MKKTFPCYLLPYRRRWGFTQDELAHLLGCNSGAFISRLEKGERRPTLRIALACYIIFDTPPQEMFPGIFDYIEKDVLKRTWDFYERIQGKSSATTRSKLDALEEAIERAKTRSKQNRA